MNFLVNLNLFTVGVTVLASLILGAVVYLNNKASVTNKTFLVFVIMAGSWGVLNYSSYNFAWPEIGLLNLRLVIFFALWQAFFLFRFFLVFPEPVYSFSRFHNFFLFPATFVTSILTLTPLIFKRVAEFSPEGIIISVENGPILPLFGSLSIGLVIAGIVVLLKKISSIKEGWKSTPLFLVLIGTTITFALVIIFNFVFPAILNDSKYLTYGSLFFLPFIVCTSYAIIRKRLLNIKVISTEILVFFLSVPILFELVTAGTSIMHVYKGFMFLLMFSVGLLLIKSVRKEVEQREQLEVITKQLGTANDRLQELDKQKTDFLSIAAHQLRTPLSISKGYLELLTDGAYGKPTGEMLKVYGDMDEANERLVSMIDGFLNISRIEQGRTKYDFKEENLNALISDVVHELSPRAKDKGLKVVWSPDDKIKSVANIDKEKIRHVVFNFVDNAIKYTEKGKIDVELTLHAQGFNAKVSDHGLGFDKKDEGRFFQKFYRGENVKGVNVTGTGIGLFVCRRFIEDHGGKVWAKSKGMGKGSEFGFWIPEKFVFTPAPAATETLASLIK